MTETVEGTPSIPEFISHVRIAFNEFGLNWKKYPTDYDFLYTQFTSVTLLDVSYVILVAISLTALRALITQFISLPVGRWLRLQPADLIKFSESVWKLVIYSLMWGYSLHLIVLSGRYNFFHNPCAIWNFTIDEHFLEPLPFDIYVLYVWQIGFYFHCFYATLYMDIWRKDSAMMIVHHFLTIFLLHFSFCMRYYKIGALVLLLHDISDILLEVTKVNVYLKSRGGRLHAVNDALASVGFLVFTASWAICRLYWFPLKVLYSTNWGVYLYHLNKDPKMYLVFNTMLLLLQFLHVYWFYFILVFLYKVATGQASAVEDTREYDERREQKKTVDGRHGNSGDHQIERNGDEQKTRRRRN